MIPIPAIDLRDGKVVRLLQGDFSKQKTYSENPGDIARAFQDEGARRLHLVDLDGALGGEPKNQDSVERILAAVHIPVQLGGGVRRLDMAAAYLRLGVRWVVLGTKACLDAGFLREAVREFGERVIVGIDARDGRVATDGWTKVTARLATELAAEVERAGAKTVIYTDIAKDGALVGPDLAGVRAFAGAVTMNVIASGGVSGAGDVRAFAELGIPNLAGVIIGKAFYEGRLTMAEALRAAAPSPRAAG